MSDLFDDFNRIFKKDFVPLLFKYLKDPNNKISQNLNDFLNDSQTLLNDFFENFSNNKDFYNNQANHADIKNAAYINSNFDDEYDDLLKRLVVIEENMIHIKKILKDKD